MFARATIAILCFGWFAHPLQAVPLPAHRQMDPETIAAYENLGAQFGGYDVDAPKHLEFSPGKKSAAKALPLFRFVSLRNGMLPELPSVQIPFGLDLRYTGLTDAGLKELKELKNLTALDLHGTDVTDAGLKELKDLKYLSTLRLESTQVTDEGLKELKPASPSRRFYRTLLIL
jgi:hypothetical protein